MDVFDPVLGHLDNDVSLDRRIDNFLTEYPLVKILIVDIRQHTRVQLAQSMSCSKPKLCALHELFNICLKSKHKEYGEVAIIMMADTLPFTLFPIDVHVIADIMFTGTQSVYGTGAPTNTMMDFMGDINTYTPEQLVRPLIKDVFDMHRLDGHLSDDSNSNVRAMAAIDEYIYINGVFNIN